MHSNQPPYPPLPTPSRKPTRCLPPMPTSNTATPAPHRTLLNSAVAWCLVAVAVTVVAVVLLCYDPVGTWWMPQCAFHSLTGWECPGCGSMRGMHALLHGHPLEALSYNYFLIAIIPALGLVAYTGMSHSPRALRWSRWVYSPAFIAALLIASVLWTILRNII